MGFELMYKIILKKRAKKFIDKLPKNEKAKIISAIEKLPDLGDIKPVKGYADMFRLRISDYRIIYSIDNGRYIILVIDAGSRGQIYKRY